MTRRVSQATIAGELGVSQRAVSKALRDEPGVSEGLRERVRTRARELGYRRNHLARALAEGQTHLVGLLLPNFGDRFFGPILDGVEEHLAEQGYRAIICRWNTRAPTDAEEISLLFEHRVDGLLTVPRVPEKWAASAFDHARHEGHPIVFINQDTPFPEIGSVASDDLAGMAAVAAHLADRGHRHTAYLGPRPPTTISTHYLRANGYRDAAARHGMTVRHGPDVKAAPTARQRRELGEFLAANPRVTALVCFNDYVALGAVAVLRELGHRVPEDCAVVGYGDALENPEHLRVPLTTVAQSCHAMGVQAADLLLAMLRGEPPGPPRYVRTQLIVRQSTGSPPSS